MIDSLSLPYFPLICQSSTPLSPVQLFLQIESVILKIENETGKKYKIIFTGGYSDLFKTSILRKFTIDKNITIEGIIEIFKKNRNYLS